MRGIWLALLVLGCADGGPSAERRAVVANGKCRDLDGDGFVAGCAAATDCNDSDKTVSPGAPELCNLRDDDCDGRVDDVVGCPPLPRVARDDRVRVPAGEFVMGSDPGEGHRDERPEHIVWLDEFVIDRHEVTNAEYGACVAAGVCTVPATVDSALRQGYFERPEFADYPVIEVSWEQARVYCAWRGGRLPTEAEWEKAARGPAPDERTYPWGDQRAGCMLANFGGPAGCVGDTDRVARRPQGVSPYGLFDMAGNVWEWTADWYDSQYYARSPRENPRGPAHGSHRVIRGGCWLSDPDDLRVSCRQAELPSTQAPNIGFRCAY